MQFKLEKKICVTHGGNKTKYNNFNKNAYLNSVSYQI